MTYDIEKAKKEAEARKKKQEQERKKNNDKVRQIYRLDKGKKK